MIFYYLLCGIITGILLLTAGFCCYRYRCRKKARELVRTQSEQEKYAQLNQALAPFGFAYSLSKDIFYSLEDAWQRTFGYTKLYDEMAPMMNMIIDCRPIYFEYDHRRWMIEFWKGQYGITTGAEVGIYVENKRSSRRPEEAFYECVSKEEQLPIYMRLYKNGKLLYQRIESHWWLTGFMLGMFSYPGELMLEAEISFSDQEMQRAFLEGCYRAGYQPDDLYVHCNWVSLCVYQGKMSSCSYYGSLFRRFVQWQNRRNCRRYQRVTKRFRKTLDKVYYLMKAYPGIFRVLTKTGRFAKVGKEI